MGRTSAIQQFDIALFISRIKTSSLPLSPLADVAFLRLSKN